MSKIFSIALAILLMAACNSRTINIFPITQTPESLLETPTILSTLTKQPTIVLTPRVVFPLTSAGLENSSYIRNDGILWIGNKNILDVSSEFCGVGWEIDSVLIPPVSLFFSPDNKYVLIDINCIEGINKAFIARLEPIPVHIITMATGGADSVLGENVRWSPDSKNIVYFRYSNCCSDAPAILPSGFVFYNLETGSKLFLTAGLNYDEFPVWSPNGHWLAYILDCKVVIVNSFGYNLWEIGNMPGCASDDLLNWEEISDSDVLILKYKSKNGEDKILFEIKNEIPPTSDAKLVNPNLILGQP